MAANSLKSALKWIVQQIDPLDYVECRPNETNTEQAAIIKELVKVILKDVSIDITDRTTIESFDEMFRQLQTCDGLIETVNTFTSVAVELKTKSFTVQDFIKLIGPAIFSLKMIKDTNPAINIFYMVGIAGMRLYNQNTGSLEVHDVLDLLAQHSDQELLNECQGLKLVLIHSAIFLHGIGCKKLTKQEISTLSTEVPFKEGLNILGKLAKRICDLRNSEIQNYIDGKESENEHLMQLITAYCTLAAMKYGVLFHYFFILKFSGCSDNIASGLKAVIHTFFENNKALLGFLAEPTRETAIIHNLNDVTKEYIPLYFLQVHDLKLPNLTYLCDGVYEIASTAERHSNSKLYMSSVMRYVYLDGRKKDNGYSFVFKKPVRKSKNESKTEKDNSYFFHIYSDDYQEYKVKNGLYLWGAKGDASDGKCTWKIVPVYRLIENSKTSVCYMISPKESPNTFLVAEPNGNIYCRKFNAKEWKNKQVFWTITLSN